MQKLAQSVLEYIRRQKLLRAGDRVGAAVSGGADSVALLRLLLELREELGIVLFVVHFNHKLRGAEADADQSLVEQLARRHGLELLCASGDVPGHAAQQHLSLEAAGRELRYEYFRQAVREAGLNRIATAHTLDDQAETVLLKVARGAGTRGLAGIYPQLSVGSSQFSEGGSTIVRPLLAVRRRDLENYLALIKQDWREDASNRDLRHARNRVRHGILPRLERNLNPAVREALAETAEIARAEEEYWGNQVARSLPAVWKSAEQGDAASNTLNLHALADLPLALRRRVVRAAAESLGLQLEFQHVEQVLELVSASLKAARSAVLPAGWRVSRGKDHLRFEPQGVEPVVTDYEYSLSVPGSIEVPEAGSVFEAVLVSSGSEYNPEHSFDPALLAKELRVRNWRAGDRYWPAHTRAPKRVKELLQQRHLNGPQRRLWPVVVSGAEIVWMRGFPAPERLRPGNRSAQTVVIREGLLKP